VLLRLYIRRARAKLAIEASANVILRFKHHSGKEIPLRGSDSSVALPSDLALSDLVGKEMNETKHVETKCEIPRNRRKGLDLRQNRGIC
jgi:hypothetical protein